MLSVENIQSAGSTLHQFLEARSALGDANLLHMLQDSGHPYGILLSQLSQQIASIGHSLVFSSVSSEDPNIFGQFSTSGPNDIDFLFNDSVNSLLSGSVPENSPVIQSFKLSSFAISVLASVIKSSACLIVFQPV